MLFQYDRNIIRNFLLKNQMIGYIKRLKFSLYGLFSNFFFSNLIQWYFLFFFVIKSIKCTRNCFFHLLHSDCRVINHNPLCSCPPNLSGDPLVRCIPRPIQDDTPIPKPLNPCHPSPCGLYAECRPIGDSPSCSCLPNYFGSPPNCRPECVVNSDCSSDKSCIAERCRNPCEGSCGFNSGILVCFFLFFISQVSSAPSDINKILSKSFFLFIEMNSVLKIYMFSAHILQ